MNSTRKKNLPNSIKGLSKEELTEILRKKKACNARAMQIVESSIEQHVNVEWLLSNLGYINQSHYDDIIEERFILKYCGYPICSTMLGDIPKQQYKISLSSKTVYDVTERKKFCSAHCFKSSQYLKSQLLTSPLWYRENETTPKFKLLTKEPENLSDSRKEDASGNNKPLEERMEITEENPASATENQNLEISGAVQNDSSVILPLSKKRIEEITVVQEIVGPVEKVERIVKEWFTINSFAYLFGEEELKKIFKGTEEILKTCLKESAWEHSDSKRFEDISKLFSILNLDCEERETHELKPLPDYSTLRVEAQNMNFKIRAFYTGQLEMPEDATAAGGTEASSLAGELPLVDSKAQTALRRKVLLDQLNKKVPELCVSLDLGDLVKIADIRCLVRTFFLSAHNITMKPREWSLATIIVLKMLTFKIEDLLTNINRNDPRTRIKILLSSFNLADDYLDNLMNWLTDADRLTREFRKQDMY